MEKLIELLNEREMGEEWWEFYYLSDWVIRDDWWNILYDYRIISKEYWFIEWLVENDKIDYEKSPWEIMFDDRMWTTFSLEDSIVMMLSISNTPIQDLISLLKNV